MLCYDGLQSQCIYIIQTMKRRSTHTQYKLALS